MSGFNLDGVRMNVVKTASTGVVNAETIFDFQQKGHVVTAVYRGGAVIEGRLVGMVDGPQLTFRYCQAEKSGALDGGVSECELQRMVDGRIRIVERFQWESRKAAGENIFEEML